MGSVSHSIWYTVLISVIYAAKYIISQFSGLKQWFVISQFCDAEIQVGLTWAIFCSTCCWLGSLTWLLSAGSQAGLEDLRELYSYTCASVLLHESSCSWLGLPHSAVGSGSGVSYVTIGFQERKRNWLALLKTEPQIAQGHCTVTTVY